MAYSGLERRFLGELIGWQIASREVMAMDSHPSASKMPLSCELIASAARKPPCFTESQKTNTPLPMDCVSKSL